MKRVLKNQKGYSLVELLVAMAIFAIVLTQIFAMMQHSARLYKNGTYEVDLQTEAQQFVQQMEELLIDVNVSVNVTDIPGSNYAIEIINKDPVTLSDQTYTVEFVKDPLAEFGEVRMTATGTITATDMPMAEYVQSVSLDMTEYTTADKVVLCVSMNNGKYSYETCKDIYLRNGVGSGTGGAMNIPEGDFDEELDVLRFKKYNLTDRYQVEGVVLDFVFADDDDDPLVNDDFRIYKNPADGCWYLECRDASLNASTGWHRSTDKYNILAVERDNHDSVRLTIQIGTKEVKVLPDGYGFAFAYMASDESGALNAVQIQGIDMTAAESAEWTMYWHPASGADLAGNPKTGLAWTWNTEGGAKDVAKNDMGGNEVRIDNLSINIADIDSTDFGYNGLMVKADGVQGPYESALEQGKGYYIKAHFHFPNCQPDQTFNINIFFAPSSTTALSDDAINNFWNMCFEADF